VRAEALATRGEHAAAVDFARATVDLAAATEALLLHADARLALATALRAAGRRDEADAEEARAIELWEAKGATLLAERARPTAPPVEQLDRASVRHDEPERAVCRHVQENAASANFVRFETAVAARDAEALSAVFADSAEVTDHRTGATYDREGSLRSWRSFLRADDLTYRHEPLATLGDALALCRQSLSGSGVAGRNLDVGAWETESLILIEVDALRRRRRTELFAADRLGDAVARLYERYAELLSDDSARDRAATTARSVAALVGPFDLDCYATAVAPAIDFVDHRTLGFPSGRGADQLLRSIGTLLETADDIATRVDDILCLQSDALLVRWTTSGTNRVSKGPLEYPFLRLCIFGADGVMRRVEQFDADRDAEALARFDELLLSPAEGPTAEPAATRSAAPSTRAAERRQRRVRPNAVTANAARLDAAMAARAADALARFDALVLGSARPQPGPEASARSATAPVRGAEPRQRVRPNAATTNAARIDAAMAAQDAEALATLLADPSDILDHTTGTAYDREGLLASWRSLLRGQDPTYRHEPLTTLGDSLALCRQRLSASGMVTREFDVGAYETEKVILIEVDEQGRRRRSEAFASDRLGDAVARLYERYAELLPDGPEHARAVATARSVAAMQGPWDLHRTPLFAPAIENVDHRILGTWSARGAEATMEHLRAVLELADNAATRFDDVLGLQADALLVRATHSGTARAGGGAYERQFLLLNVFATDGLVARREYFDADREAEALGRFDELVSSGAEGLRSAPPSARFENAATRFGERFAAAWKARDWERVAALYRPGFRRIDRRAMVQLELDRDQQVEFIRPLFEMSTSRIEFSVLATRGNRLALVRLRFDGADRWTGPTVIDQLVLIETDDLGEALAQVIFDTDDLDAAYAETDERYAAGEAAPLAAAVALKWLSAFRHAYAARDWESFDARFAPDFVVHDHSPLGWGTLDRSAYAESLKELVALAPDFRIRTDHLWLSGRAALGVHVVLGTHEGGAFEQPRVTVNEVDAQGRERRRDIYTLDQLDEAWARFAAIDRPPLGPLPGREREQSPRADAGRDPLRIPPNAATRASDRVQQCMDTGAWDALRALCAPIVFEDRRRLIRTVGDCDMAVTNGQVIAESGTRVSRTVLATAGDCLVLEHVRFSGPDAGLAFEVEALRLIEVDAEGHLVAGIIFDPDDRRAASLEMLERYARSDAARWAPAAFFAFAHGLIDHDLDRVRAALPDDFVFHDHRRTGLGRIDGADDYIASLVALFEQSPDAIIEPMYEVATARHGALTISRRFGTLAEGGAFESVFVNLVLVDGDRFVGAELFELEDLDVARARFEELRPRR
jgi:hypothetical protein